MTTANETQDREVQAASRCSDLLGRWLREEISAGKFAELLGVPRHIGDEILTTVFKKQEALRMAKYLMDNCNIFTWKRTLTPLWSYQEIYETIEAELPRPNTRHEPQRK